MHATPLTTNHAHHRLLGLAAGLAALVALTGGVALAAAPAGPRLSAPLRIIASEPNVPTAVNAAGQAVTLRPDAGPGPALQLATSHGPIRTIQLKSTTPGYDNPSVAIAESGAMAAIWDTSSTDGSTPTVLELAIGSFGLPPTTATALSPAGTEVFDEQVYVNPRGATIALWNEQDGGGPNDLRAAIVLPGATPTAVTLDAGGTLVGAGLDATGALDIVEHFGSGYLTRSIRPDGSIGPAAEIALPPSTDTPGANLKVLVDGAGDQLYSWASPLGAHEQLNAIWRSAVGVVGPAQALGADLGGAGGSDGSDVALNASGRAVAVLAPNTTGPLRVRFASRLGGFSTAAKLGAAGRFADDPDVGIDGPGRTLVTWLDSPRSARGTSSSRELVAEAHGTRFTTPVLLPVQAGLGHDYEGDSGLVAADPSGTPALVTYGVAKGERSVGQIAFLLG
jgi:hypothetical protein